MTAAPEFDNSQAAREGWGIYDCSGSSNGPYQLQKDDMPDVGAPRLPSDEAAWEQVWTQAHAGSAYHQSALTYLLEQNPLEYACIARCNAPENSPTKVAAIAVYDRALQLNTHPGAEDWPESDNQLTDALIESLRV